MDNDLDTVATALYASTDDFLKANPDLAPWRPAVGLQPLITDAAMITVSVMRALLGFASELVGFAETGYCASHSRWFWGLRLHLLCTLSGLPVGFALTGATADERTVLLGMLDSMPAKIGAGAPLPGSSSGSCNGSSR